MAVEEALHYLDIANLGRLYRRGEISPVDATRLVLSRIRELDGRLNAFITVMEDSALRQAEVAHRELKEGIDRGPLHGIPVSLKDLFDIKGVPTTAASPIWKKRIADKTSTAAQRLLDAGAVIIGKCNMLEFGYGMVHPDFEQCNNPWDLGRTSGGSSSGSSASVAAGMGWGSLGSDTGGSIRVPASYCGVVGFKPTLGRVSRYGTTVLCWTMDTVGTLARTVEDTAIILQAIAGYDPLDPESARDPVPDYCGALAVGVSGLRAGILEQYMGPDLQPGLADVANRAIDELANAGMEMKPVRIPNLADADAALLVAILPEGTVAHQQLLRACPEGYTDLTRMQLEIGALIPAVDYIHAQEYRRQLLAEFQEALRDVDVLISPTAPSEAPKEDPMPAAGEGSQEARRTGPFNLTGMPAISVPCGFGPAGLPLGLQIVGRRMNEALILRVAYAYESRTEWHRNHPPLN